MNETVDVNLRIRELPNDVDKTLEHIAITRQVYKWEIIRAALVEFAENHRDEVPEALRK